MKLLAPLTGLLTVVTAARIPKLQTRQDGDFIAVTGVAHTGTYPRLPVQELHNNDPDQWNMFILGMEALQAMPEDDPLSYYGIASIHGKPWKPWGPGDTPPPGPPPDKGYCAHSSIIFGTWHRYYLSLLEQEVVKHAQRIAEEFPDDDQKQRYRDAASRVRFPYWDSADAAWSSALPSELSSDSVTVTKPSGEETIYNPLYGYRFQPEFAAHRLEDFGEDEDPYFLTEETALDIRPVLFSEMPTRRRSTYYLLGIEDVNTFTSTDPAVPELTVETLHGSIHNNLNGWMSPLAFSSYHPIFFLHHGAVERTLTIWQAVHPATLVGETSAYLQPANFLSSTYRLPEDHIDDASTPLYPFRRPDGTEYTSNDVRDWWSVMSLGYYFPEMAAPGDVQTDEQYAEWLKTKWRDLYYDDDNGEVSDKSKTPGVAKMAQVQAQVQVEWEVRISFERVDKRPASVVVVLDGKEVGSVAAFTKKAQGVVFLNPVLKGQNDLKEYLKQKLEWKVVGGDIQDLKVMAGRRAADGDKLAKGDNWIEDKDITEGKEATRG